MGVKEPETRVYCALVIRRYLAIGLHLGEGSFIDSNGGPTSVTVQRDHKFGESVL